jgi:hypothetical protein
MRRNCLRNSEFKLANPPVFPSNRRSTKIRRFKETNELTPMPNYRYASYFHEKKHPAFDQLHHPGSIVPDSGIYRCEHCGREDACNAGTHFPPQNHHQHPRSDGKILWRLVAAAITH